LVRFFFFFFSLNNWTIKEIFVINIIIDALAQNVAASTGRF
jgi:hypothetical protein